MITRGGCFTRTILCLRFFDFVVLFLQKFFLSFPRPRKKRERKEDGHGAMEEEVF